MIESLPITLTNNQVQILKTVLYFDVFNYPLSRKELFENTAIVISWEAFEKELEDLLNYDALSEEAGFVLSAFATVQDITKRLKGNAGAREIMPKAYQFSKKVASYPFVEGVCISGGLSKNYYDDKSDIDFFIIARPGRLWICRSLLILKYKLLPKNLKRFWCTNYFISSDDLSIPDINAFTGTELAYLVPTVNYPLYKQLLEQNNWYKKRFPNKPVAADLNCVNISASRPRSFFEWLLSGKTGAWLDDLLLNLTLNRWKKKYPELDPVDFELQFRSRRNVCKRHTKGFQNKVLNIWEEKMKSYEDRFRVSLR